MAEVADLAQDDNRMTGDPRTVFAASVCAGRAITSASANEQRLELARAVVLAAVRAYWRQAGPASVARPRLRHVPRELVLATVPAEGRRLATDLGKAAAQVGAREAAHAIGQLYTAMMPDPMRAELGAYYTPPALCDRLLDMATDAGVDWSTARVLDPACGGGAFLVSVALRMAACVRDDQDARTALEDIGRRLVGFELDPFAAWLSQVFLDVVLAERFPAASSRTRPVVQVCDSLEVATSGDGFDLVVGNPPYGRVTLTPPLRGRYARSLFGHANLYGLFTDLALRLARKGGVVAYVTPTSFLSGEYFKALRSLLGREAPPVRMDFVGRRKGVFADVLQETLLATHKRGGVARTSKVRLISPLADGSIETAPGGSFRLPQDPATPWLIPRSESQGMLLERVGRLPHRLADWGYSVSTGPLVWNRHKARLRDRPGKRRYPLLWAESVRPDGRFEFRAEKRNHRPYFEPDDRERWVVTDFPCVLVQRTTAKEQCRRLIAAELPRSFLEKHGAVVVENHLNMIKPGSATPGVTPAALAAVLNSDIADQLFRCINGSVAVSAYELAAVPLPAPAGMQEIEGLVEQGAARKTVERAVARAYGCPEA